jgi:hypothetical protein
MSVLRLRTSDITWREVDEQIVVLDLQASTFLELNRSGSLLWRALADGAASSEDLVEHLATAYGIDGERATRDVKTFLDALGEANLLER